jgi:hypothetical protein
VRGRQARTAFLRHLRDEDINPCIRVAGLDSLQNWLKVGITGLEAFSQFVTNLYCCESDTAIPLFEQVETPRGRKV